MNLDSLNIVRGASRLWVPIVLAGLLAACASSAPKAPVETRGPGGVAAASTAVTPPVVPPTARPGYHIVKRGETLYSIAREYGQTFADVAAWNNLSNAAVIEVGQELRITPPDSSNVNVVKAPSIEVRPIEGMSSTPAPAGSPSVATPDASTKSTPRGGRVAYSQQAWNDVQTGTPPLPAPSVAPAVPAVAAPASVAGAPSAAATKADEPPATASGDDGIEWMWPATGKVVATFNDTTNKGVDIAGSAGQPIMAAGAGTVLYVGSSLRGYGNLVIIRHNNAFLSAYAHNKEILVKEGQTVQKGQKIASMGDSDADRVMLHFEIRRQGKPVDPTKYLPQR
ncbi:peptidoglycan DD-metalloendopeptidase family protein [Uliginosibacterium sp. sgz301328]|uniref:peptidoglycan DD-metalloendopeptidase family protein n=1 Tax=Uliginosibacterium sp. sgz301328 TaxID=3243764 RepID=UPI00359D9901